MAEVVITEMMNWCV